MQISDFDYHLPEELIAQEPLRRRDESRMLILDRRTGGYSDSFFQKFPEELSPGSLVVINNTRVFPARLIGKRKGTQGKVEVLLLRPIEGTTWEALVKPGRAARRGAEFVFSDEVLHARVVNLAAEGKRLVEFLCAPEELNAIIDRIGLAPLPPYIRRPDASARQRDAEAYQTIFAKYRGAIAAPTAGLHFTREVLQRLRLWGVEVVELTLHVGYGTFKPVRVEEVEQHEMDAEQYHIPEPTADAVNLARQQGRPIIAVGTTTVRALESAADENGSITPGTAWTTRYIYPGYHFRVIDGLLTNLHLPRSTPLILACAFAGRESVLRAYRHAVDKKYRFYSFGDCMLIK